MNEIQKKLICIRCPMGCEIDVSVTDSEKITVNGNICKMGQEYAKDEIFDPRRIITTTVKVSNGRYALAPVWTTGPVPKNKTQEIMHLLSKIEIEAPVNRHQVIIPNILGLNVDIESGNEIPKTDTKLLPKKLFQL